MLHAESRQVRPMRGSTAGRRHFSKSAYFVFSRVRAFAAESEIVARRERVTRISPQPTSANGLIGSLRIVVEIIKRVLTDRNSSRTLVKLFATFVSLSAGQGGLLFDNRYDVPESVRNYSSFSSTNSLSLSSDNNSLGQAGSDANRSIFFRPSNQFQTRV